MKDTFDIPSYPTPPTNKTFSKKKGHRSSVILKIIQKRYKRTVKSLQSPFGVQRRIYTTRRVAPSLMGLDGTEYQKCPSIFVILCGYIKCIYLLIYEACQKFSTQYRPFFGEIFSNYMVLFLAVFCFFRWPLLSKIVCSECSVFTVIYDIKRMKIL